MNHRVAPTFMITYFCNHCNIWFINQNGTFNPKWPLGDLWPHIWTMLKDFSWKNKAEANKPLVIPGQRNIPISLWYATPHTTSTLSNFHRYAREIPDLVYLPRVMVPSAMGLKLEVFEFLPTTHAKTNVKPMHPRSLHAVWCLTQVLSLRSLRPQ